MERETAVTEDQNKPMLSVTAKCKTVIRQSSNTFEKSPPLKRIPPIQIKFKLAMYIETNHYIKS